MVCASLRFALLAQRHFCLAAGDALGASAIRLKNESHAKASPARQRRRPPPVAETGRSCWGSGQQGASAFARSNRWEPQPVRWHRASARLRGLIRPPIDFLLSIAYNIDARLISGHRAHLWEAKQKHPRYGNTEGVSVLRGSVLTGLEERVIKPLANVISNYTCCDRQYEITQQCGHVCSPPSC